MPNQVYDLNPVDRILPAAVGEPGKRVFYLQARKGRRLITMVCEKEHVAALAIAAERLLLALAGGNAEAVAAPDPADTALLAVEYPLNPLFRVGQLNLGYDEASQRLVIIAQELLEEDDESTPSVVRLWATPAQMRAFSMRGQELVAAGRPTCAMCGQPMEPEGHYCIRRNGHGH